MRPKISIPLILLLFNCSLTFAQKDRYRANYNRIGIQGGIVQTEIFSDNILSTPRAGFTVGLTTRGAFRRKLDMIYGINFYQFNTGIQAGEVPSSETSEIDFKATGVQINLFASPRLIKQYLSLEAGPVVQINSGLRPGGEYEDYYLRNLNAQAKELKDVTQFNFNLALGLSGGTSDIKVWLQYQYGLTNWFKNISAEGTGPSGANLKANLGLATFGAVIYL